jgi:undecaprenyl pyrophosphate phosphatase UppP
MQVQRRHDTRAAEYGELILGIAQVGALIPGVSRSGSTLTASRTCTLGSAKRRFNSA